MGVQASRKKVQNDIKQNTKGADRAWDVQKLPVMPHGKARAPHCYRLPTAKNGGQGWELLVTAGIRHEEWFSEKGRVQGSVSLNPMSCRRKRKMKVNSWWEPSSMYTSRKEDKLCAQSSGCRPP